MKEQWETVNGYCADKPWPTPMGIRWIIWKYETTFKRTPPFVMRLGRRVLIEGTRFNSWLNTAEVAELHEEFKKFNRPRMKKYRSNVDKSKGDSHEQLPNPPHAD